MAKQLEDAPTSVNWIRLFRPQHQPIARLMLQSLKLVSSSEFETAIAKNIATIHRSTGGPIAVFAVNKAFALARRKEELGLKPDPSDKVIISSAGRTGSILTGVKRHLGNRILYNPTLDAMRKEKVKHVVLVDDLIGTGKSICDFWNAWAWRSLKSWLSSQHCKLWIAAYAGHQEGLGRIKKRVTYLDDDHIHLNIALLRQDRLWRPLIKELCVEYAPLTAKPGVALGFGDVMSPIVFQYGCPNNAPAILWARGGRWQSAAQV